MTKKNTKQAEVKATKKATTKTATEKKAPVEKSVKVTPKKKADAKAKVEVKTKAKVAPKKEVAPKFDHEALFPKKITVEGEEYKKLGIASWEEVLKADKKGAPLYIAIEFEKSDMKFYATEYEVPAPKEGFESLDGYGFDFLQVVMVQTQYVNRVIAASLYTEAVMAFVKGEIKLSKAEGLKVNDAHFCFYGEA